MNAAMRQNEFTGESRYQKPEHKLCIGIKLCYNKTCLGEGTVIGGWVK